MKRSLAAAIEANMLSITLQEDGCLEEATMMARMAQTLREDSDGNLDCDSGDSGGDLESVSMAADAEDENV